jgi:hypothetical protein
MQSDLSVTTRAFINIQKSLRLLFLWNGSRFYFMATLYRRNLHVCNQTRWKMLSRDQRQELGKVVLDAYLAIKLPTTKIHKVTIIEGEETFKVITYPRYFSPFMDAILINYYKSCVSKVRQDQRDEAGKTQTSKVLSGNASGRSNVPQSTTPTQKAQRPALGLDRIPAVNGTNPPKNGAL